MFDVVVVYPLRDVTGSTEVLLGRKNRGLGIGRIVGPGGKVEPGEDIRAAAVRELVEEVGLVAEPADLVPIATITYPFPTRPQLSQRSFAFALPAFHGEVRESAELTPDWWPLRALPLEHMWADAKLWLPSALAGTYQEATITIGDRDDVVDIAWNQGGAHPDGTV